MIKVERPARYPKEIVFENRFGGLITIKYIDGEKRYIGQVLRPMEGVGRFLGSEYADVGRHTREPRWGYLHIYITARADRRVPDNPGRTRNEQGNDNGANTHAVDGDRPRERPDPSIEGMAPFFKYFLQPKYSENEIEYPDWEKRLLERFLVEVQYKGKDGWEPMPEYHMS